MKAPAAMSARSRSFATCRARLATVTANAPTVLQALDRERFLAGRDRPGRSLRMPPTPRSRPAWRCCRALRTAAPRVPGTPPTTSSKDGRRLSPESSGSTDAEAILDGLVFLAVLSRCPDECPSDDREREHADRANHYPDEGAQRRQLRFRRSPDRWTHRQANLRRPRSVQGGAASATAPARIP